MSSCSFADPVVVIAVFVFPILAIDLQVTTAATALWQRVAVRVVAVHGAALLDIFLHPGVNDTTHAPHLHRTEFGQAFVIRVVHVVLDRIRAPAGRAGVAAARLRTRGLLVRVGDMITSAIAIQAIEGVVQPEPMTELMSEGFALVKTRFFRRTALH
eukprot:CAMPEP_0174760740 /NCGR_PEP_ID=MMETSP1094-20130205/108924_1 /TAXON_ID=156173 /ORGANISM="Chrysochromulina brevifilum, Strain UTEX LB 985" /LENGTH=156 /DNA_ID=CAMNT_0015966681 /DNA_START=635 /DNA_END=1106 /DNA_ORIENTATION=+